MPFLLIVAWLLLLALCVTHLVKTGRDRIWLTILLILPLAGSLAYLAVEVIPDLLRGEDARKLRKKIDKALDPEKDLRDRQAEAAIKDTTDAKMRYAEELAQTGRFDDAIAAYRSCLTGLFAHDPVILLAIARLQFGLNRFGDTIATLDEIQDYNPEFKSAEGHLIYARALEGRGDIAEAKEAYAAVAAYYPGAEARARYALLLSRMGETAAARAEFKQIVDGARLAPHHALAMNREWIELATRELGAPK